MIRSFRGRVPRIHKSAFVHASAEIIGDAVLGAKTSVWPHAVLRADVDAIRIGERTNVQDCAVVHCREGRPAVIGKGVTVGHGAVVHGSRIGDLCLVGMGAIVMEATIGRECLIAAGAMVPAGMRIPPRSMVMGVPAKVRRRLSPRELAGLRRSSLGYTALAEAHRRTSRVIG
ncbi:MAG: gamma carbonic anhydrase family protein [Elusimicrobia bacterium]|nr:gamma carbonic anhydrase family protein [Elusimicrobiota bacterium]